MGAMQAINDMRSAHGFTEPHHPYAGSQCVNPGHVQALIRIEHTHTCTHTHAHTHKQPHTSMHPPTLPLCAFMYRHATAKGIIVQLHSICILRVNPGHV